MVLEEKYIQNLVFTNKVSPMVEKSPNPATEKSPRLLKVLLGDCGVRYHWDLVFGDTHPW